MSVHTNTRLESTEAGTANQAGIIDGNWAQVEALFDPTTGSGNSWFALFLKCLIRSTTLPTDAARLEWDQSAGKMIARPGWSTTAAAGTFTVDFKAARLQRMDINAPTTVAFANLAQGREVQALIVGDGSTRTLTFPGGIVWLAGSAPANIAAGKTMLLKFFSQDATANGVLASYEVQP